ncbi:DUF2269 family protein [Geobacter sp. AOG1]|uniref:DUF2269 family protein n=1 Tax=Geobacter sp. AOG1 TaxID=1566346 RepID=UPI001CC576D0|nr:DUF2269 family protein [Geobacter sp. AOG1]GFE57582.1 hypothetical protein AOG1_14620 [Geobacter sp. AOG1]
MLQHAHPTTRQILKCIHLTAACIWIGGGLTVLVLLHNDRLTRNGDELFAFNHAIRSVDDCLIKPAAVVSSASGLLLCVLTSWGLARHRWIVVKGFLTLGAILFGAFYLGPWLRELSDMTAANRLAIFDDGDYARTYLLGAISSILQTLLLFGLMLISIFKPSFDQKRSFSRRKTWDSCFAFISRAKS